MYSSELVFMQCVSCISVGLPLTLLFYNSHFLRSWPLAVSHLIWRLFEKRWYIANSRAAWAAILSPSCKYEHIVQFLIPRPGGSDSDAMAAVSWQLLRLRPLLYWRAQTKFCAPFPRVVSIWLELGLHFHAIILKMVVMKGILYVGGVNGILPDCIHFTSDLDKIRSR
jgi:hypothetical protein